MATAANAGSLAADDTTLRVRLVGSGSPNAVRSFTQVADVAAGAAVTWPLTIETAGLAAGTYTFFFEAERAGAGDALATATLVIADVVAPDVQMLAPAGDVVTDGEVTLVARVTDDASPIVRVEVRVDAGAWQLMAPADAAGVTHAPSETPAEASAEVAAPSPGEPPPDAVGTEPALPPTVGTGGGNPARE